MRHVYEIETARRMPDRKERIHNGMRIIKVHGSKAQALHERIRAFGKETLQALVM